MGAVRIFILALLLTTPVLAQDPPVKIIRFMPQVGAAPLYVRFTVVIEPHADNRSWCYGFFEDGIDVPTIEHCEDLEGDKSAKFHTKEEKHVDQGDYHVIAFVQRARGTHPLRSLPIPVKVGERFPE